MFSRPLLLSVALLLLPALVAAQEKPASQTAADRSLPIGLVNVEKVAQQYKPFAQKLAGLQEEAKELQTKVTLRQSELEGVRSDLQKAGPNSPDTQRLQNQFVRLQRELQAFIQEGRQKLREKELKLSLSLHREIDQVLKPYCKAKGLKLIVRTQNSSLDENQNDQQILQTLNRGVLYDDGLDITADVLKLLEEQSAKDKP